MGEYADAVKEHGGVCNAARAMGLPRTTFSNRLTREKGGRPASGPTKGKAHTGEGAHVGITEEELLLKHSPEDQIRHAAEGLTEGRFFTEAEFVRKAGVRGAYRHIVERSEFAQYRGRASGGIYYWGHPSRITALKEKAALS